MRIMLAISAIAFLLIAVYSTGEREKVHCLQKFSVQTCENMLK